MIETARTEDLNGYVEIRGNPISKEGVFPYAGRNVPGAPNPDAIVQVYRPAEELSDPECIASFRLVPWIDNHTMLGSTEQGLTPAEQKGVQGVIGEDVYFKDGTLYGNLKVFSQSLASLIEAGKRELSCGYRCVYEWTEGVFNGQRYDAIMRRIRGNHIASVSSGRMGPDVAVLDGIALDHFTFVIDTQEPPMAEENKEEAAPAMTLEQALEIIKQLREAGVTNIDPPAEEAPATPVADTDSDKPKGDKDEEKPKDKDDEKKGEGMDAAIATAIAALPKALTFKEMTAQFNARNRLAEQLSHHVGTFDHSEMTVEEVAAYGITKLGIKAPKGAESAVLEGYLQGKGKPSRAAIALDSANTDNFVTRHLKKGA